MNHLPTPMLNTFYALARVEYASLDKQLQQEIKATEHKAAAAGALSSGRTILMVCEAGAASLSVRCRLAWTLLFKAMSAHGLKIDRETASLFLSELGAQASASANTVRSIVGGATVFRTSLPDNARQAGMKTIEEALEHELAKMKAETDLLVAAGENATPTAAQPTIAVNGDGNVIVVGDSNQVSVATQIDQQAAAALVAALNLTLDRLSALPPGAGIDATQVKQVVEETIAEIETPKPNGLKVSGAIKTVAETIKFIPSLKAAYDAIKSAAAMVGIHLP